MSEKLIYNPQMRTGGKTEDDDSAIKEARKLTVEGFRKGLPLSETHVIEDGNITYSISVEVSDNSKNSNNFMRARMI